MDPFNLQRFVRAQEGAFARAPEEIARGRTESRWIWFLVPEIDGLGRSKTARRTAIAPLDEARASLAHPLLQAPAPSLGALFPSLDDLTSRSSMTLVDGAEPLGLFQRALDRWCAGVPDPATLARLAAAAPLRLRPVDVCNHSCCDRPLRPCKDALMAPLPRRAALLLLLVLPAEGLAQAAPGLPVRVEAEKGTSYLAKCHVRSFKGPDGLYGNTYTIDSRGPFHDVIPSVNAQCLVSKVKGEGPVVLHIVKGGDHAVRVDAPGTWVRLNVW